MARLTAKQHTGVAALDLYITTYGPTAARLLNAERATFGPPGIFKWEGLFIQRQFCSLRFIQDQLSLSEDIIYFIIDSGTSIDLTDTLFALNSPNNTSPECLASYDADSNGIAYWINANCSSELPFICQQCEYTLCRIVFEKL